MSVHWHEYGWCSCDEPAPGVFDVLEVTARAQQAMLERIAGQHQPTCPIPQLRALIDIANDRHLHDAADYLAEVVQRAEGRMGR